jgi:hypothetical protein
VLPELGLHVPGSQLLALPAEGLTLRLSTALQEMTIENKATAEK